MDRNETIPKSEPKDYSGQFVRFQILAVSRLSLFNKLPSFLTDTLRQK